MGSLTLNSVSYVDLAAQHEPIMDELLLAIRGVLEKGQFVLGPEVEEFERAFARLCGVEYAIGVNSGTDALILTLRALGIGPGDEVITPPNSFVASASCIALVGATPVFVDVKDDYNIDPREIEKVITPRTRAILPVHLTGRPAEMSALQALAKAHGLYLIEDCAQAVLAEYNGQRVGSFGEAGCFSLHPLKTLNACGDGGVITTNCPKLAKQAVLLRNLGLESRENCIEWASNSRLDTLQAAILLVKMKYLNTWTETRRAHARFYQKHLSLPEVKIPLDHPHEYAVYHTFVIQAERRDELKQFLAEKGIQTSIHYPRPIHLQEVARPLQLPSFPVTEKQARHILSLPIHHHLSKEQLYYVVESIKEFYS